MRPAGQASRSACWSTSTFALTVPAWSPENPPSIWRGPWPTRRGLRFDGLMGYEGHVTPEEQAQTDAVETWLGKLQAAIIAVEEAGYPVSVVSGAGTTTYRASGSHERVTEVQCGTYVFMDGAYGPEAPEFTTALTVVSQVMSRPVP